MTSAPMNGNVDHVFAFMMIPHHQGAVDMAKVELIYGTDPVMRRLAQEILVDQQSEIEAMRLCTPKVGHKKGLPSLKAKVAVEAIRAHKTAAQIAQMFGVHPT